jgi:hypothetical protein
MATSIVGFNLNARNVKLRHLERMAGALAADRRAVRPLKTRIILNKFVFSIGCAYCITWIMEPIELHEVGRASPQLGINALQTTAVTVDRRDPRSWWYSAWGPNADRRGKSLKLLGMVRSKFELFQNGTSSCAMHLTTTMGDELSASTTSSPAVAALKPRN